jgi:P27 family predicted phage terminase small subunit
MRGRKAAPTRLIELHGCPGKRKRSDAEPRPAAMEHDAPPAYLSTEARAEWARVVTQLRATGIISQLDTALLGAWCSTVGDFVISEQKLRQEGLVVDSRDRGPVRNPWVMIKGRAIEQMIRLGSELGMSPASRPRLRSYIPDTSTGQPELGHRPRMSLEKFLSSHPDRSKQH